VRRLAPTINNTGSPQFQASGQKAVTTQPIAMAACQKPALRDFLLPVNLAFMTVTILNTRVTIAHTIVTTNMIFGFTLTFLFNLRLH
jgi:hypothetical protein